MDDFDTQWDNLDIDTLDTDITDTDGMTAGDKKADRIIDKKDADARVDTDFDNWLDDENPEGYNAANKSTQWRKIISKYEANVKDMFTKKADEFNYQMSAMKDKYQNAKASNSPMTKFYSARLNELNAKRQEIVDWAKGNITELNYLKGRASGFITPDNAAYYDDNPDAVRAELATGKYEYKPTTRK